MGWPFCREVWHGICVPARVASTQRATAGAVALPGRSRRAQRTAGWRLEGKRRFAGPLAGRVLLTWRKRLQVSFPRRARRVLRRKDTWSLFRPGQGRPCHTHIAVFPDAGKSGHTRRLGDSTGRVGAKGARGKIWVRQTANSKRQCPRGNGEFGTRNSEPGKGKAIQNPPSPLLRQGYAGPWRAGI